MKLVSIARFRGLLHQTAIVFVFLFVASSATAAQLNCEATMTGWSSATPNHVGTESVEKLDVLAHRPANALYERLIFSFSGGYEMEVSVDLSLPKDQRLFIRYDVYKNESGRKRAIGGNLSGIISDATTSSGSAACIFEKSTTCLAHYVLNVDVQTIRANLGRDVTLQQGYKQGLIPLDMPSLFGIRCSWYR
jgi:hypothetical protein